MPRFTMTWGRTGPKPSGKHNTRRPGATPPRWEFYWADRVGVGSTSITLGADLSDGGSNALNSGDRFDGWAPVDWCDLCCAGRSEAGAPPTIWLLLRISRQSILRRQFTVSHVRGVDTRPTGRAALTAIEPAGRSSQAKRSKRGGGGGRNRSEEHTSEL